jgi:hypothetical protein
MHARQSLFHFVSVILAALSCVPLTAQAQTTLPTANEPAPVSAMQSTAPSPNNEKFKQLKAQCEADVPPSKVNGDTCVDAGMLLLGDPQLGTDVPDEFRDMKEDQRVKIALRLFELGVPSSNLARSRAYDLYNKVGFLGVNSYADTYRANELMAMMVKSGYSGGILRKIRSNTSIIAFGATDEQKKDGCATAKKMLGEGKLDADSAAIAKEVTGSNICVGFEPPAK